MDFYRPIAFPNVSTPAVRIHKVQMATRKEPNKRIERAIRLYCTMHATAWALQIRAPLSIGNGYQDGKDDVVANASLSREDLLALRAAIDEALGEK